MAFTLICYVCRHKLKLFDSSIKKRKGTIRCPYCSARISYDLDSRKIQKSGFWATEEPAFDPQTKDKMLNQLEGDKNRKSPVSENFLVLQKQTPFGKNPFQASAGFTGFDLKSGQIWEEPAKLSLSASQTKHPVLQRMPPTMYRKEAVHSTSRKPMSKESFLSFSWTFALFHKIKNFFHQ